MGSPNQYIVNVINKHWLQPLKLNDPRIAPLLNAINDWAGKGLSTVKLSGSSAKGTGLKGSADLDLFISLKQSTPGTLREIYDSLYDYFTYYKNKYRITKIRRQNVSVRIYYKGFKIDMVPGKKLPGLHNQHHIHVRRDPKDRIQTNIDEHISHVLNSGGIREIIALKRWRDINGLEFPSIYIELLTIEALKGLHFDKTLLARNFMHALSYIGKHIVNGAVYDIVNKSNVISRTLTKAEKQRIQRFALRDMQKEYLEDIIW